jgi:hypothetical protein
MDGGPSVVRERTTLYRLYGTEGRLLYIGITMRLPVRLEEHEEWQPWWADVVGATMEHFVSRRDAERAELAAIAAEGPAYNVVGSPLQAAVARRSQTHAGPRPRHDCPLCGSDQAVYPDGRLLRHSMAVHNEYDCILYYGSCPGSGERWDSPLPFYVRMPKGRPCAHERTAMYGRSE